MTPGSLCELCNDHSHFILWEKAAGHLMTGSVYRPLCYLVVLQKKLMLYNCKEWQCVKLYRRVLRRGRKPGITVENVQHVSMDHNFIFPSLTLEWLSKPLLTTLIMTLDSRMIMKLWP